MICTSKRCQKIILAPLRGAFNCRPIPVVYASLRPPATFSITLRVVGHRLWVVQDSCLRSACALIQPMSSQPMGATE